MVSLETNSDEPLTPTGRLFLRPELNTIIHCAIGFKHHMDISSIRSTIASSLMVQHSRFRSLLVIDKNGVEHWRPTKIDINRHVVLVDQGQYNNNNNDDNNNNNNDEVSDIKVINDYLADLSVSSPHSTDKPLWEVHILLAQKCVVFRIHHALGDGISLMSLLLANCRKAEDPTALPSLTVSAPPAAKRRGVMEILKMVFFSLAFCLEFLLRSLWVRDRKTVIAGGHGVELWPRKMATARFLIDDMKVVKNAVSNATINDVLFGVISAGLSRYLHCRSSKSLKEGTQITGVAMVNLRPQPQELSEMMKRNSSSRWGNKFGMLLLPVYYRKGRTVDPLQSVRQAKVIIDRKKQSFEAHFSYKAGDLAMSWLGPKVARWLNYRFLCNTSFMISNLVGPKEEITIAGNPITLIRALTMQMTSYAGRADMQILAAKDIIPDPEFLAQCFEDALLEMKKAAAASM